MTNLVEYEPYTENDAQEDIDSMERTSFFKFEKGPNHVRFVPARKGEPGFYVTYNHYLEGPGGNDVSVNCPRVMSKGKKRCPICEAARTLADSGTPENEERAKDLFAKRRVYACIIDRNNEGKGVQVVAFGSMIHEELARLRKDKVAGGDFFDPNNGFDIIVEKTGSGKMGTRYKVRRVPDRVPMLGSVDDMNKAIGEQPRKERFGQLMEYGAIFEAALPAAPELAQIGDAQALAAGNTKALPSGESTGPTAAGDLTDEPQPDTSSGEDDNIPW